MLLLQKPCACQWKSTSETVLGTVVASFCSSSRIAHAWERAAGVARGLHWEMHQIRKNRHYLPVATMKSFSEAWWAVPDISTLFITESRTRTMLMDHCNQTWAFRVDVVLPFSSSHWFLNALNLYMSILWLNAWVVRRRYSKPVAPVPFHVTDQTCHLVNNIFCCKKGLSC